jgi:predicted RNA-binding protein with PUA-like domain
MNWLLKSEPDVFSYSDLEQVGRESWNGVRNYQARNFLRQMVEGEQAFFYHSSTAQPGIVGICQIARAAYPDDLQFKPSSDYFDPKSTAENIRWSMVDVVPVRGFPLVSLERLRLESRLENFPLIKRGNRLSVLPVSDLEWETILELVRSS